MFMNSLSNEFKAWHHKGKGSPGNCWKGKQYMNGKMLLWNKEGGIVLLTTITSSKDWWEMRAVLVCSSFPLTLIKTGMGFSKRSEAVIEMYWQHWSLSNIKKTGMPAYLSLGVSYTFLFWIMHCASTSTQGLSKEFKIDMNDWPPIYFERCIYCKLKHYFTHFWMTHTYER